MPELIARPADRPLLMGVVNVTPDSFSDGGRWLDADAAVRHGLQLLADGADLLDIGGESTRPGATRPSVQDELDRVVPVVGALARAGATVSVDTMRAEVAARAVDAGAAMVNDVSGGVADPAMARVVSALQVPFVAMHWRGHSHDMQTRAVYDDVVAQVGEELRRRAEALVDAGIDPTRLVLDPGLGFAKTAEHNWALLAHLDAVAALGFPILVGTSRKRFLATIGAGPHRPGDPAQPVPPQQRDAATAATTVLLAQDRVWGVRVHEVRASRAAVEVVAAVDAARRGRPTTAPNTRRDPETS